MKFIETFFSRSHIIVLRSSNMAETQKIESSNIITRKKEYVFEMHKMIHQPCVRENHVEEGLNYFAYLSFHF